MLSYKDLRVYNESYRLALVVYRFSLSLPRAVQYDIADQLRRASRSIPSNIAEGYGRTESVRTTYHFLKIALGSNEEVLFNLTFLRDSKLGNMALIDQLTTDYTALGRQLNGLIRHIASRLN